MRVSTSKIKYIFLIAPYLMSAIVFVIINSTFANFLLAWKLVAFIYLTYEYLKEHKLSMFDVAVFLYFAVWLISTFVNGESVLDYCKEAVVMIFYLFCYENAEKKKEIYIAINVTSMILFIELVINLVCIIIFPNGLWHTTSIYNVETNYYFLGMDNQATPLIIIALVLMVLYYYQKETITLFAYIYAAVILLNTLLMGSATCIAGVIVFVLFLILSRVKSKVFNIRTAIIILIAIYFLFVVFRAQDLFKFFIVNVLQRDVGLSARTGIWDNAIQMIKEKPFIGYGCKTFATLIGDRHAHNMYLQIMLQSGLFGFTFMLNYVRIAIRNCFGSIHSALWASAILAYGICCMMEVYNQGYLILMLSICSILSKKESIRCYKKRCC